MFFSVIIPCFNAKNTIVDCVKSIKNQSFENYEVIIIDDGSTDNTVELARESISDKANFTIISKENEGVSIARNVGIQASLGKYLIFLDSDDSVSEDYLSKAHLILSNNDYDILFFNYYAVSGKKAIRQNNFEFEGEVKPDKVKEMFLEGRIKNNPWDKTFKRSTIVDNGILFPERITVAEDALFTFKAINVSKRMFFFDEAFVYYRLDTNGVTKTNINQKKIDDIVFVANCFEMTCVLEKNSKMYNYLKSLILDYYFYSLTETKLKTEEIEEKFLSYVRKSKVRNEFGLYKKCYCLVISVMTRLNIISIFAKFRSCIKNK